MCALTYPKGDIHPSFHAKTMRLVHEHEQIDLLIVQSVNVYKVKGFLRFEDD